MSETPIGGSGATGPDVSILIPVLNEIDGLARCYREVVEVTEAAGMSIQIVFVNDGSTDGSGRWMRECAERDPRVTYVGLAYNVGQQRAMYIGLGWCRGRAVVTYDSDLQFHPGCIPLLAKAIHEGRDIAGGIREIRHESLLANRIPSHIGKLLINRALRVRQEDFGAVKAYSQRLVRLMLAQQSPLIVIPAMAYSLSRNAVEIPVLHQPRRTGISKWSLFSRMELYLDIYTTYGRRPFEWMMFAGALSLLAGVALGLGILGYWLFVNRQFGGLIIFFDVFMIMMGAYFFTFSFIGEFVVRIFRGRPLAAKLVVSDVVGAAPGGAEYES